MNDREWNDHLQMSRDLNVAKQTLAAAERELAEARRAQQELSNALRALVDATAPTPRLSTAMTAFDARTRALGALQAWGVGE